MQGAARRWLLTTRLSNWRSSAALLLLVTIALAFPLAHGELLDRQPPSLLAVDDLNGKPYSLKLSSGQVVVVSFWTTWCQPCRAEMPSLERMAAEFEEQGVTVVAVNVGEPRHRVKRFRRLPRDVVRVLLDSSGDQARAWGVDRYPTAFIIDRDGKIFERLTGIVDWDGTPVTELLRKLAGD